MNTTANLPELLQRYYDETFLSVAEKTLVFDQFGQKRPLPKYKGILIQFQRYKKLSLATTPLTEGTNPSENTLEAENVEATVKEYGDWLKLSSLVSLTAMDRGLAGKTKILGLQSGETFDRIISNEAAVNGTEQIVSTKTAVADILPTDVFTMKDIKLGVRNLKNQNAMAFADKYFACVIDPDVEMDLYDDELFVNVASYQDSTKVYKGEIGKWFGARFVVTTQPYRTDLTGAFDENGVVHNNCLIGKEAYGVTELQGARKNIIVKTPGPQDTSNPLNMYGTCGWYNCFVTKVLNANWILNIKTGATA